jgi:hypothetical protein
MWFLPENNKFVFHHPFRTYIAGPTTCGKTKLVENILINRHKLIDKVIERIVICYKAMQESYENLKILDIDVEFHEGIISSSQFDPKINNLLILDDLMSECKDSNEILKLFTVDSHHRNISVFLISQNIYTKGKCAREINLNSSNMIIFKNPRDNVQISILGRQMFPSRSKAFLEAFKDATVKEHGYLFLDFTQKTPDNLRIQANVSSEKRIIYTINE